MSGRADLPTLRDVEEARARLSGFVRETPLARSRWLSEAVGADVFLKLECFQTTGSFKIRGAANRLLAMPPDSAVVAVSAGNHARAVAECAERLGIRATVVMARSAAPTKIAAIRRYDVDVRLEGASYDEAEAFAVSLARASGLQFVSPYNDPAVIAGQGTVALEVFDDPTPFDAIVVPTGGGGLLAGVGLAAAPRRCRVVAAQPAAAATLAACFDAGKQVDVPQGDTLADGLAGNLERGSITVGMARATTDHFARVSEEGIAEAVRLLVDEEHVLAEPSGAVGVAAVLAAPGAYRGQRIAIIVTGANVGASALAGLVAR